MADLNNPNEALNSPAAQNVSFFTHPNWGAIWAGMFAFLAIWAVFGTLGVGIFASAANANAAQPLGGMNVGIGAWFCILTIIAFFFAGRITGRLARTRTSGEGAVYGLVMFGVAVAASALLISIGGTALDIVRVQGGVHSSAVLGTFSYLGWITFIGLFLGWLAAMAGASNAHRPFPRPRMVAQPQVRHA